MVSLQKTMVYFIMDLDLGDQLIGSIFEHHSTSMEVCMVYLLQFLLTEQCSIHIDDLLEKIVYWRR